MFAANKSDQGGLHGLADLMVGVSMAGLLLSKAVVHSGIKGGLGRRFGYGHWRRAVGLDLTCPY